MRWHDLLMQNILICILCTTFEMEITKMHQWNTSVNMHAGCNPTNSMYTMVNHSLGETHAVIPPTHIGHGRFKAKSEKELSDAAYTNPSSSACSAMYEYETKCSLMYGA